MRAVKAVKRDAKEVSEELTEQLNGMLREKVAEASLKYLNEKILPLLQTFARALSMAQPKHPQVFAFFWLAQSLNVPEKLLQDLVSFLEPDPSDDSMLKFKPQPPSTPKPRQEDSLKAAPHDSQKDSPSSPLSPMSSRPSSRPGSAGPSPPGPRNPSNRVFSKQASMEPTSPKDFRRASRHRELTRRVTRDLNANMDLLPPRDQLLAKLKKIPAMESFTDANLERVADLAKIREFDVEEAIVNPGEVHSHLYWILRGSAKVFVPQPAGSLQEGSLIGEHGLKVHNAKSPNQVIAAEGGVVAVTIAQNEFEALKIKTKPNRKSKVKEALQFMEELPELPEGFCMHCRHRIITYIDKTDHDREVIVDAIKRNHVLNDVMELEDEQCEMIADQVTLVEVNHGQDVFQRGDIGNGVFFVHDGMADVILGDGSSVAILRAGDCFGEIALLYGEPRSATIRAKRASRFWFLDRNSFQSIVQDNARKRMEFFASVLREIPDFLEQEMESQDESEVEQTWKGVSMAFEEVTFSEAAVVCQKGQDVGLLFVVLDGECEVEGTGEFFGAGNWFGLHQVKHNVAADMTVVATSPAATIMVLDHSSYEVALATSQGDDMHSALSQRSKRSLKTKVQQLIFATRIRRLLNSNCTMEDTLNAVKKDDIRSCEVCGALGEGSFGLVLLLRNKESKIEYAFKGISKKQLAEENQMDMVKNERSLMLVLDSPFCVRLYRSFEDSNFVYLMLEVACGGELFDVYADRHLYGDVTHARFYWASVCLALVHLHSKRIIYRDLKLENCLLDAQGNLKVTDMGIAKMVMGATYTVCGTADYFAPETLRQVGYNRAVDWWASGVLLFIMLVGRSPFDAADASQIYRNIIKGIQKVSFGDCPKAGEELIKALCKKKPEERLPMQRGGISNVVSHRFFEDFSFEDLESGKIKPPLVPGGLDYEKVANKKLSTNVEINWEELVEWEP
eukprot:TRINITY_DN6971_c0_g1_i1.p1 TRINITY_DN6971_c0_g1~~TRINITY_DN6971_c0_g1_i1.p1  ORF type:complete len:961 (+),score=250.06 TRINITY_DN6971_c0_g1_i1:149-3031(+)